MVKNMKVVVERNCSNYQYDDSLVSLLNPIFGKVVNNAGLNTLDYFVIVDSDIINYCESVKKYASIIGSEADVTQDGQYCPVGKTLDSVDETGKQHQAILIISWVWESAAEELHELVKNQDCEKEKMSFRALSIILHEIGHAVDNENQFKISGTVNNKIQYNLKYEFDEYIKQNALSLWGEYSAESFACKHDLTRSYSMITNEKNLFECIVSYSMGTDSSCLFERTYRILYFFMLRLAALHQQAIVASDDDYNYLRQDPIASEYDPMFVKVEQTINNLNQDYPKWDSYDRLNDFSQIIKDFLDFERKRQWRIKLFGR